MLDAGVTHVIVLEGINDIGQARSNRSPSSTDLIAAHRQIVEWAQPFVFDHPDKISFMTGAGSDRTAIATAMSNTWVAFARTGNPNHSGIPQWAAFNPATGRRWLRGIELH